MKRNLYIFMSLIVLASMVLTACGGGGTSTSASATQMPPPAPTPTADLYLFYREGSTPVVEGELSQGALYVWLGPGNVGQNVSVELDLSDGNSFPLKPNPEEQMLPGYIGGSQLFQSSIVSSDGTKYIYSGHFNMVITYVKEVK